MKENLSAWIDGELGDEQARSLLAQTGSDTELRGNWDRYHLIGDAMRGVHGPDLCAKIRARLKVEPTVLAPQRRAKTERWRNFALSAAASIAAAAFVGWMALPWQQDAPRTAAGTAAETRQIAQPAGEGAKDYLLAHQRYSPSSSMQGVAPYVRTVADERSAVRR